MTLNWLSLAVFLYLILGALAGWRRGLVLVGTSVVGYILGLVAAAHFQAGITRALVAALPLKQWALALLPRQGLTVDPPLLATTLAWVHMLLAVLVFLLILLVVEGAARLIGQSITDVVRAIPVVRSANTLGGLAGGLVENMLIVGVVLGLVVSLPLIAHGPIATAVRQSPISADLVSWVGRLAPWKAERWLA